ncbi:probable leucine-rich repeat protein SHOC-2 [Coccomyxa sp. Obi]|nr:probable leucine-rich repeat protein SHOC-2 [Coccomyxa sp. Obi]
MDSLPVETLQHIGSFLPFAERRTTFPLICKAFAAAACCNALGDLWASIALEPPPKVTEAGSCQADTLQRPRSSAVLSWLAPRASQVEHLFVGCRALQPEQGSFAQLLALFRGSPKLKRLDILCCAPVDVSAAILMLPSFVNLEILSIQELDGLRDHGQTLQALSSMTNLRSLRVSLREGFLRTWPDLARLHRLETLNMRGCPSYGQPWAAWGPFPGWITQLASLRSLSIGCAGCTEVPPAVATLTQLTRLALEDNCFGSCASPSGQLPAARQLPCGFGRLINLKSLSVGTWSGSFLPEEICALTGLEELSWRGALPCDEGDDYYGAPDQAQHPFTLPKEFGRLRKLRVLKLDCHTGMTQLPPQVLELTSLETLDVSNALLACLPEGLDRLPNLATLRAASCSFTQIPPAVFSAPSLRCLDLSRNPGLELGELSRTQLALLAKLGRLSLAKLGDCAWLQASLPALEFLESSSRQRRRRSAGSAEVFRADMLPSNQAARGSSGCRGKEESICVLERQSQGCLSVGVWQPDGRLLQVPLAV